MNHDKFQYIVNKPIQPIYNLLERHCAKNWMNADAFYLFQQAFTTTFNSIIQDPEYVVASDMVLSSDMILKALQEYGFPYAIKVPENGGYTGYRVVHKHWIR